MAPPERKPAAVLTLFKDVAGGDLKIPKVKCNGDKNGSRMKAHIGKCKNCTDDIKHKYFKRSNTDSTVIQCVRTKVMSLLLIVNCLKLQMLVLLKVNLALAVRLLFIQCNLLQKK